MAIRWEPKRPNEVRDYKHDWGAFLAGDAIVTSVWDAVGVITGSEGKDTDSVTIWLSGGVDGTFARLTNTITTAGGRTESETFAILIREADEPVSIADARTHLRVDSDPDDALIWDKIVAAREWVEDYTGLVLLRREVTETLNGFTANTRLRAWPIAADEPISLTYRDTSGAGQTIADAVLGVTARPALIYPAAGARWPSPRSIAGPVYATFTAGYPNAEAIPQVLRQALLVMLTAFYEDREGGEVFQKAEASARMICRRHKRRTL